MNFDLTEEQRDIRKYAREFLRKEIAPMVDEQERRGQFSKETAHDLLHKLHPFGYVDGLVPTELGGSGLSYLTFGMLLEEVAYIWASLAGVIMIHSTGTSGIARFGTAEHRERLLPALMRGDKITCTAITEPDSGSNSASMKTTAVLQGDHYVVNGMKTWISNATISDICVLTAVTDKSQGSRGMSRLLVERDVSPYESRELHKLGMRAFPTGELFFDDCKVPKENLVGSAGEGYKNTLQGFETARSFIAARQAGICQAAVDASVKYARERTQWGRPIGSFQMVQEMIVDMIAQTDAMRLLAYRALDMADKGQRCRIESSLAKAYATEAVIHVTSKAIQVHGAMGLSEEFPLERYFRDARMSSIPDGTTQIQKLIVGRDVIGISAIT